MKTNRETRARVGISFREATEQEKNSGYLGAIDGVIPYNSDSELIQDRSLNRGRPFIEQLAPDAFKRSIAEDGDIMGFVGHTVDPHMAFARKGENLTLSTDGKALRWSALIPDTTAGRDLATNIKLKIIRGTSFEFSTKEGGDKWEKRGDQDVRTITEARLYTVNPVAFPAYPESELTTSIRGINRHASRRAFYAYADTYDPTLTDDCAYALDALADELDELADATDYLRNCPQGALVEYATEEAAESAESAKELIDFIAANAAKPAPAAEQGGMDAADMLDRAIAKLSEARSALRAKANDSRDADWEQRQRAALGIRS